MAALDSGSEASSNRSSDAAEHVAKRQRTAPYDPEAYPWECEEREPTNFGISQMVTIYVGTKQHKFMIHKDVLLEKSPYFQKCLKPAFVEGRVLEVKLPDVRLAGFEVFVHWIYSGHVQVFNVGVWPERKVAAIEAWVLADRWFMHEFQNKIVEAFKIDHRSWTSVASDLLYVCRLGMRGSVLGSYLFDQLANHLVCNWMQHFTMQPLRLRESLVLLTEEQPDLVVQLLEKVCQTGFEYSLAPCHETGCKYHVHGPDHPACGQNTD